MRQQIQKWKKRENLQKRLFLAGGLLITSVALGQTSEMKNTPRTASRTLTDDTQLEIDTQQKDDNKAQFDAVVKQMSEQRSSFEARQPAPTQNDPKTGESGGAGASGTGSTTETTVSADGAKPASAPTPQDSLDAALSQSIEAQKTSLTSEKEANKKQPAYPQVKTQNPTTFQRPASSQGYLATPLRVFNVSESASTDEKEMTVLPTGSHVKARLVSGVEANAREPYPVLLQLDYAFTGPNKTRINLSNCFMIAKAKANMSTERVIMETEKLSCVRENGEHIKRDAKGFVAGADNTFGATGTYISKQGQVLLAAVLASIAKNAGAAIADAQKSTSVLGADKAAAATNITGSKAAFVAGSAMVDGAGMIANWYLEQAKELLPSIGVGSGADVFVVMLDSVLVPSLSEEE
jgi:hypothetical protein